MGAAGLGRPGHPGRSGAGQRDRPQRDGVGLRARGFHRYAVTSKDALTLLDDLVEQMEARKRAYAGATRLVPITTETPLEIVEFDEIGALLRYRGDRKTREAITDRVALLTTQGRALGFTVRGYVQEPTKDTVPVRELFPRRICLRVASTSHVSMVLGDQAYEQGAWANRIGEDEPGVGYLFGDGIREPLRVRAGWVSDGAVKDLETFVTRTAPPADMAAPVLTLPAPTDTLPEAHRKIGDAACPPPTQRAGSRSIRTRSAGRRRRCSLCPTMSRSSSPQTTGCVSALWRCGGSTSPAAGSRSSRCRAGRHGRISAARARTKPDGYAWSSAAKAGTSTTNPS
ncbi:Transfer protein traSA [Pseudonocardia sp. Ae168_Ps1]|nr:Transfer protein traSA [Pseudonocardia sp. Ae150A_Ps1]OLL79482.1 Transfer protein traSA [Pseudonocardia sp. Ae168_Ps1]OLL86378.1 Transfer protein traSA [Pseudonocardia sp. Ae263_Ps1]OLL93578.1 Transfer protein traSA [Pseudonocardia sp. Ae356_Ps1]